MYRPSPESYRDADLSDLVSEQDKLKAPYLMGNVDMAILQLVKSKAHLRKYRDLYEGFRDPREYAYLESNFGIGNPMRVKMIPIIRNRVQVLLGQHLTNPIKKNITCTDQQSISLLEQEKVEFTMREVAQRLATEIAQAVGPAGGAAAGMQPGSGSSQLFSETQLQELNERVQSFQASLEIGAQHVLDELLQSTDLRLKEKFTELLEKLLVEALPLYRVVPRQSGHMPDYEVIPPEELHFALPPGTRNLRDCPRFVRRRLMTRQEVLTRYGYLLDKTEREVISGHTQHPNLAWASISLGTERYLDYYGTGIKHPDGEAAKSAFNATNRDLTTLMAAPGDLVEVFHVEWLACNALDLDEEDAPVGYTESGDWEEGDYNPVGTVIEQPETEQKQLKKNKTRYREDRYEGVRIGSNIYCALGRSRNVVRSINDPWRATCSYRGYVHDFSLVGKTKDIQDSSDILHYQAENLVASSGVKGTTVDAALLPTWLDADPAKRAAKHRAYRKQGTNWVDSSMEDANNKRGNAISGDFDESLDGNSLRAIREQIAYLDEVASNITGVNRQMLGAITNQDLVGNTQQAMVQATLITKPLFQIVNTLIQDSLTDLLNACRVTYKTGRKGVLTLGEAGQQVFSLHSHFPLADYRVFVADGQEEAQQLQEFKMLSKDFIGQGLLSPEDLLEMVTNRSLTDVREKLKRSAASGRAKKESEMQQQIEQLTKQLDQAQKQVQGMDDQKMQQMQAELQLQSEELQILKDKEVREAAKSERELDQEDQRIALERDQIAFNKSTLEVKNN